MSNTDWSVLNDIRKRYDGGVETEDDFKWLLGEVERLARYSDDQRDEMIRNFLQRVIREP